MNHDESTSRFLRNLTRELRALSPGERDSILQEIEGHIAERIAAGASTHDVLSALGPPEALAAGYVDQDELYRGLAVPSPAPLLGTLLNRATTSAPNFLVAVASLFLFVFGASFLAIAVLKLIAPEHVGYWSTGSGIDFGIIARPPAGYPERLGMWIIPIALLASVLCYLVANALLRRRARWLVGNTSVLPRR